MFPLRGRALFARWVGPVTFGLCTVLACIPATGAVLTYDRIIYEKQDGVLDPTKLSGHLEMDYDSTDMVLTIMLRNTSLDLGSTDDARQLLSGLGFNLPGTLAPKFSDGGVLGNGVTAGSSIAGSQGNLVNFTNGSLLSTEWGYDYVAGGISSGHFNSGESKMQPLSVDTSISSHQNDMRSLGGPDRQTFGGKAKPEASPGYGLLSAAHSSFGNGQAAVEDSITITMILEGAYGGDVVSAIDADDIVLMFGSPDTKVNGFNTDGAVPEPTTVAIWSLFSLLGFAYLRRARRRLRNP